MSKLWIQPQRRNTNELDDEGNEDASFREQLHLRDGFKGRDREGGLVFYLDIGHLRMDSLYERTTHDRTFAWIQSHLKRQLAMVEADGQPITIICDLDGISWHHVQQPALSLVQQTLREYDCSLVRRIIMRNAPIVFPLLWSLLQPWLTDALKRRVLFTNNVDIYLSRD